MRTHAVSYDLKNPGQNYTRLITEIKKYGSYCKVLESFWFVRTNESAQEVRDRLKKVIDQNDQLLVIETKVPASAGWTNLSNGKEVKEWLEGNS